MAAERQEVEEQLDSTPEPSLREQIESARDEVIDSQVERGDVEAPKEGRARDASGRFTRSDKHDSEQTGVSDTGGVEPRAAPAKGTGGADQGTLHELPRDARGSKESPTGAQKPPAGSALEPPQGWTAAEKEGWNQIPSAQQAAIVRREQDMHRRITEDGEVRSVGNQFMTAANEHAALINARGGNPVALFREFLGILNRIHSSDPQGRVQLFRQLAIQNGVNLDVPTSQQPSSGGQTPSPQRQVPIDQLVSHLVNQQLTARQEHEDRQREAVEVQQLSAEIESFRSDPKHTHFNTVTGLMAGLLRSGEVSTLEEAYQLAVKAHPETSKILEQEAQAQLKTQEDARRRAEAAKRKTGSLRPGPGAVPQVQGSKGTVRDDLRAAMEEVRGRV